MKPHVRAAVAAICISHNSKQKVSSVYDYSQSKYINIEVSVSNKKVEAYDYTNSCHIEGNMPSLYHYGNSHYLDLKQDSETKYSGYDYGSTCYFEITVKNKNCDIYDYGTGGYFSYST